VPADVDDAVDRDAGSDVCAAASAHHGDEGVAVDEARQLGARLRRRIRVLRPRDDRREDAVEVEEDRRRVRRRGHTLEQRVRRRRHG